MKKYYPLLTVILLGLPLCSQALTLNLRGGYRSASHAYETLIQVSQGWNNGWWASFESNTWNTIHNNENELFALNYNHALQEKLSNREREIDHLQAQLDKLRRMNFGSRSEKVSRRIAQMEADLNRLQKESDTLTGRVYDPAVQRPLADTLGSCGYVYLAVYPTPETKK